MMEPRLVADLLLRLGHDPPGMVAELCRWCWEEEEAAAAGPRVEVLRLLLDELCWRREARGLGLQWQGLRQVAEQRCLPLLRALRLEEPGERRLALSVCGLLPACCRLAGPELLEQVAASCLRELRAYSEQRSGPGPAQAPGAEYSDIRVVMEMLVKLWPLVSERDSGAGQQLLPLALAALRIGEDGVAATVVTGLIPALLEQESVTVRGIWDRVRLWELPCSASRLLLLLSSLSSSGSLDLRACTDFWKVVQAGLVQPDNTTRKRALYLLKRAVDVSGALEKDIALDYQTENDACLFWWLGEKSKQLVQLWENYILIMETLEENQVHVIRPILPRLKSIMDATVSNEKGNSLFHSSWVLCAYKRMFASENKTVIKEGLFHFLDLDVTKYSIRPQELSRFFCGPVMDALSESTFYGRSPEQMIGSCPVLGVKLQTFFVDFMENMPVEFKGDFLTKMIKSMAIKHWCAIPIFFISQALEHIPSCKTWGVEGLQALREVLCCTLANHQILLRGATQCFLLQTAMHLTNVGKTVTSRFRSSFIPTTIRLINTTNSN